MNKNNKSDEIVKYNAPISNWPYNAKRINSTLFVKGLNAANRANHSFDS